MTIQTSFFGFGIYPAEGIHIHGWITNPSNQKVAYVAAQASVVFKVKQEHGGKETVITALEEAQRDLPFDSTGKILSIAVIASDVIKRKEELKRRSPSSYKQDMSILLLSNIFRLDKLSKEQDRSWIEYSPLVIFSPANMTEIALLNLVDDEIESNFRVKLKNKLTALTLKFEKKAREEKDEKYLERLAVYKAEIQKL